MPNVARPIILTTEDRDSIPPPNMPRRGGDSLPRGSSRLQYGAPAVVGGAPALAIVPVEEPPDVDDEPADEPAEEPADEPEPNDKPNGDPAAIVEQLKLELSKQKRGKRNAQENV